MSLPTPSQSWLNARVESAMELCDMGVISQQEYERVKRDADTGVYTGPMKRNDGSVTADEHHLRMNGMLPKRAVKRVPPGVCVACDRSPCGCRDVSPAESE